MRNLFSAFALIVFFFGSFLVAQQPLDVKKMDAMFDALEANNRMMGSVTLTRSGKVIYNRVLGFREISDKGKLEADTGTEFRIGSITKVFTSVMIYQLIGEKKLSLDTKLSAFFPEIPSAEKISIAQLLSHRSGLPSYPQGVNYNDPTSWVFQPQTSRQMLAQFALMKPLFNPGENYRYSNTDHTLLGYIIESLTNSTYGEQLDKRIIRKIGLKRTHYGGRIDSSKNEAHAYNFDDDKWNVSYEQDPSVAGGSGGISSTSGDLAKFITALFGGKLLKPELLHEMITSPADNLRQNGKGIGNFEVLNTKKKGYSHDGGFDAFRSLLTYVPDDKFAFAITINGHNYPMNKIFRNVVRIYYDRPVELPSFTPITLPVETLAGFEGTYSANDIELSMTIKKDEQGLTAQTTGQAPFRLEAISPNTFMHTPSGILIEFQKNADNSISSFTLYQQVYEFRLSKESAVKK